MSLTLEAIKSRPLETWRKLVRQPGEESFAEFYEVTRPYLVKVCYRILRSQDDVLDALQVTYSELVEIARQPGALRQRDPLQLGTEIATRNAERIRKARSRKQTRITTEIEELQFAQNETLTEELSKRETAQQIQNLLGECPEKFRMPLLLYYFHDLTHEQIGEVLGISRAEVSKRIAAGCELLQGQAEKLGLRHALATLLGFGFLARWIRKMFSGSSAQSAQIASRPVSSALLSLRHAAQAVTAYLKGKAGAGAIVLLVLIVGLLAVPPLRTHWHQTQNAGTKANQPGPIRNLSGNRSNSGPQSASPLSSVQIAAASAGNSVGGQIISAYSRQPISNVRITASPAKTNASATAPSAPSSIEMYNDADGEFRIRGLADGTYKLSITPPAPWLAESRSISVSANAAIDAGVVELRKPGVVAGRVIDPVNKIGVGGARLSLRNAYGSPDRETITQADGSFSFEDITAPLHTLIVAGYDNLNVSAELEDAESVQLTVPVGKATVSGTIFRDGKPQAESYVRLFREPNEINYNLSVSTASDGTFEFHNVPPGKYMAEAASLHTRFADQITTKVIQVSGAENLEDIKLDLPCARFSGTVLTSQHLPAPNVPVIVRRAAPLPEIASAKTWRTTTSESGAFRFSGLSPGEYEAFACFESGKAERPLHIALGFSGELAVTLQQQPQSGGTLISHAYDYANGRGIEKAWCELGDNKAVLGHSTVRSSDGRMTITGIPPGTYHVNVSAFGFSNAEHTIAIADGTVAEIHDVLSESGGVKWSLQNPDGSPAAAVACHLEPTDSQSIATSLDGDTDANGVWTVRGIFPGSYRLSANSSDAIHFESIVIHAHNLSEKLSVLPETFRKNFASVDF